MKRIPVTIGAGIFVLFGTLAGYSQNDKPGKTDRSGKKGKALLQKEPLPQPPRRSRQEALAWQQQKGWLKQGGGWQGHETWQQGRAERWSAEHRTWVQRGGYGGFYVPQETFSLSFGNTHFFRIASQPTMHLRYPRFEYGGFAFLMLDPWPEYWADNWYDVDDLYIDYDEGYYLHNRSYAQVRLAIAIEL